MNGQVYSTAQKKLATTIRALREAKGVSQERFAQLANVERARYGRIERGELNISLNVLFSLAAGLGVKPCEILGDIELADCQPDSVDREPEDSRT
ncbi:helix-turn-helix transcriptional regulator [Novosphingobium resinovorum]|nr:helix-turn-helix transcriptional regulator [Novosphingobium resinovorum]